METEVTPYSVQRVVIYQSSGKKEGETLKWLALLSNIHSATNIGAGRQGKCIKVPIIKYTV